PSALPDPRHRDQSSPWQTRRNHRFLEQPQFWKLGVHQADRELARKNQRAYRIYSALRCGLHRALLFHQLSAAGRAHAGEHNRAIFSKFGLGGGLYIEAEWIPVRLDGQIWRTL